MEKKLIDYLLIEVTDYEKSLVQLTAEGNTPTEIAKALGKTRRTIETQTYHLRKRFECRSSIGLIVLFYRNKLIK